IHDMKKQYFLYGLILEMLLFSFPNIQAQEIEVMEESDQEQDSIVIGKPQLDKRYREDQFYLGLTFNFLNDLPTGARQSGISVGLHAGCIRDIPFNNNSNYGIRLGLRWSINSYRSNLLISETEKGISLFQILDSENYDYRVNRFSAYLIEAPIQFRWRTSSADSFRFWRIYTGLQIGYAYYFHSKFVQEGQKISISKPAALNRLRYGVNFTFGYNTFNFTVYYSLNSFFDGRAIDGQEIGMKTFKVGLMFYIL